MTGLLISVRDLSETREALAGGADVIDMKEPRRGSLGPCEPDVWRQVCCFVDGRRPVSAALGELLQDSPLPGGSAAALDYVKLGLAGCAGLPDWEDRWAAALDALPQHIQKVAVAYADHKKSRSPAPDQVLSAGIRLGCRGLLLDTFGKNGGDLFSCLSVSAVSDLVEAAQQNQMLAVLAGSLRIESLEAALASAPDLVAVRSGVCRGSRAGHVDRRLVRAYADRLAASERPTIG